jgi:hypothetical protein
MALKPRYRHPGARRQLGRALSGSGAPQSRPPDADDGKQAASKNQQMRGVAGMSEGRRAARLGGKYRPTSGIMP